MALPNSIGQHEFIALRGFPLPVQTELVVLAREGAPGVAAIDIGKRGQPFTLRSQVDAQNFAHARRLYRQYTLLIGQDPVPVVWSGVSLESEGWLALVIDVRPVRLTSVLARSTGNALHPPSFGWCECDWTLVAVPTADTGEFSEPVL